MKILCSTGALIGRPNGRDYRILSELVPKLECDGLEFMLYSNWYDEVDAMISFLNQLDIKIPVMHCQKTVGELISNGEDELAVERYKINCEIAKRIGASKMVMHLWNGLVSDSNFSHNLEMYPRLRDISNSFEVDLLIENVLCNVKTPYTRLKELRKAYPDVHFVFDTKMAEFHDELRLFYEPECSWMYEEGHIKHYHVNDYGGGYMTWNDLRVLPVGEGHIDFAPFFSILEKIKYDDTLTVEATAVRQDGSVDINMLNKCFRDIRMFL